MLRRKEDATLEETRALCGGKIFWKYSRKRSTTEVKISSTPSVKKEISMQDPISKKCHTQRRKKERNLVHKKEETLYRSVFVSNPQPYTRPQPQR